MQGSGSKSTDTQRVAPRVLVYRSLGSSLPMLLGPIAVVDATHDVATFQHKLTTGVYDFVVCEVRSGADAGRLLSLLRAVPKQAKVVLYSYASPAEMPSLEGQQISVLHGASVSSELLRLIQSGSSPPRPGSNRPGNAE